MGKHVVVGAGQIGTQLAGLLNEQGHEVTVVSRSGNGPAGVTRVRADASDQGRMIQLAQGADALYNCVNPPYHRWTQDWPPMAAAFLAAAERSGAVLVTTGNLYVYGPVDRPMTEDMPLAGPGTKARVRTRMWEDMLAAHQEGRIRATELRGSDYFGPGTGDQAHLGMVRFVKPLLAGRRISLLGNPDLPHSWTYVPDVARALAVAGTDERAWGRAWHVPTNPALSARDMGRRMAELAGVPEPKLGSVPKAVMRAIGVVSPAMREMGETRYQFERPYVLDSTAFQSTFGMPPTPLDDALTATINDATVGE